jgi:cell division protein FtsL
LIQANKSYVYGSAAKKLEYDVYEENKVLKAKKLTRLNNKYKFKVVCMILLVFTIVLAVIFRYAMITELSYNIDKSVKQYGELKDEHSRLMVEIEKATDLNKIRDLAERKLGMHEPDKYQVVYIRVPKSDFTKVADAQAEKASGNNFILSVLAGKFAGLLNILN